MSPWASFCLFLHVLCLLSVTHGSAPVVTSVHQSMENQIRQLIVRYEAQEKPVVLWKTDSFIKYIENSTNSFSGSQGEATLRLYVDPRYEHNRDETVRALIFADSYQISLDIKQGDNSLSEESNTLRPLMLNALPEGTIDFDDNDVVNVEFSVESQDLGSFEMIYNWADLTSFDYESVPSAIVFREQIQTRETGRFENRNAFIMPKLNISGGTGTVERTTAIIDTSYPYTEGEIEFGVSLGVSSVHSLLDKIILRRFVYLKERSHEGPFRNEVNFMTDGQNRKRVDVVADDWLYTQEAAIGYPKPDIKLYRDCLEVTEPEVETYSIGTPYRTMKIFQFKNATDRFSRAYYFKAISGDKEITRMNFIEKL